MTFFFYGLGLVYVGAPNDILYEQANTLHMKENQTLVVGGDVTSCYTKNFARPQCPQAGNCMITLIHTLSDFFPTNKSQNSYNVIYRLFYEWWFPMGVTLYPVLGFHLLFDGNLCYRKLCSSEEPAVYITIAPLITWDFVAVIKLPILCNPSRQGYYEIVK